MSGRVRHHGVYRRDTSAEITMFKDLRADLPHLFLAVSLELLQNCKAVASHRDFDIFGGCYYYNCGSM